MAINLLSPGIKITEADLTASVTSTGTTIGGIAGAFKWGPTNDPTLVGSESELATIFGKPDTTTNVDFLTAANFLAYSPNLYVVRVVDSAAAKNASDGANTYLVENADDYENSTLTGSGAWIAKYPGALGNSLKVSVCGNTSAFATWSEGNTVFDFAPGTSPWALSKNLTTANDEVHVVVIDEDGLFSGVAGTVLEKFPALSKASDARAQDGGTNYYKNVVNTRSKYVWWAGHPAGGSNWGTASNTAYTSPAVDNASLDGGADGTVDAGDYVTAYQEFSNKQNVTISVLPVSNSDATVVNAAIAVAEGRKDTMVCFSPERSDVVNAPGSEVTNVRAYADTVTRSTYALMDSNWKYQYDKYNDVYIYVPCAADVAGCLARVDATRASWFSPAGYTSGRILNAVKLAWNPTPAQRDELYKYSVNPIFTQPGRGTILFGDKTFVTSTGSFSRVNVRRLFIQMESAIEGLAGDILFEQNDEATRERFVNAVEPYLRTIQGGRGIEEFKVVCDGSNNTEDIVTTNGFVADIFVRPIGSINFIQLNFVSVGGAAAFAALG